VHAIASVPFCFDEFVFNNPLFLPLLVFAIQQFVSTSLRAFPSNAGSTCSSVRLCVDGR